MVQEGLELPEDEEEKKKTEADKEKFGELSLVPLITQNWSRLKIF